MLPFVVRGIVGGRHWTRVAAIVAAVLVAMAATSQVTVVLNARLYGAAAPLLGRAYPIAVLPMGVATGVLWTPLLWFFLVPAACALLARRWMRSDGFRRDVATIPDAAGDLAAALLVFVAGVAVCGEIASSLMTAGAELLGLRPTGTVPAGFRIAQSKLARAWIFQSSLGSGPPYPMALAAAAEVLVRTLGIVVAIARVVTYFALLATARSVPRALAAILALRAAESLSAMISWSIANFAQTGAGSTDIGGFVYALVLAMLDFAYAPFLALAWACVAAWAATRLHDRVAAAIAAQDAPSN